MGKIPILPPKDNEAKTDPIVSLFGVNSVDDFSELTQHANRQANTKVDFATRRPPRVPGFQRASEQQQKEAYKKFQNMKDEEKRQFISSFLANNPDPYGLKISERDPAGGSGSAKNLSAKYDFVENSIFGLGPKLVGDTLAALRSVVGQRAINPFSGREISDDEIQINLLFAAANGISISALIAEKAGFSIIAKTMKEVDIRKILRTAEAPYNSKISKAGRALGKRQKKENNFPKLRGNQTQQSKDGSTIAKKILEDPKTTFEFKWTDRNGNAVNFVDSNKLGIKTDEHGNFITFIDKSYDYIKGK